MQWLRKCVKSCVSKVAARYGYELVKKPVLSGFTTEDTNKRVIDDKDVAVALDGKPVSDMADAEYVRTVISSMLENVPCFVAVNDKIALRFMAIKIPARKTFIDAVSELTEQIEKEQNVEEMIIPKLGVMLHLDADQPILYQAIDPDSISSSDDDDDADDDFGGCGDCDD